MTGMNYKTSSLKSELDIFVDSAFKVRHSLFKAVFERDTREREF